MEDLTVKLADELWCHVFGYVSSVSQKYKVAAVNTKFRRCIMAILATPMPLELHFAHINSSVKESLLNGCHVPLDKWPDAVKVLAEQTNFSSIMFFHIDGLPNPLFLETILQVLIGADCLGQVASFKSNAWFFCNLDVLQTFIAKCTKLEVLDVMNSWPYGADLPLRPNLTVALKDKPLTELSLELPGHDQAGTAELFAALAPHKLRKVRLHVPSPNPFVPTLVKDLGLGAWSAMEDIHLSFYTKSTVLRELFVALLTSLPHLRRCHIKAGVGFALEPQFVPIVVNESERNTNVEIIYDGIAVAWSGCWLVDKVHQIQAHHPAVRVDFGALSRHNLSDFKFELGNVSLCVKMFRRHSCNCINCLSFYSHVFDRLLIAASMGVSTHVEDCQLDSCRVGRVAADLERYTDDFEVTEVNQAQNLVTITLVSKKTGDQFDISIACGQC